MSWVVFLCRRAFTNENPAHTGAIVTCRGIHEPVHGDLVTRSFGRERFAWARSLGVSGGSRPKLLPTRGVLWHDAGVRHDVSSSSLHSLGSLRGSNPLRELVS